VGAGGGSKEKSFLTLVGKADEASFPVGVGAGFEIEFVEVQPAIGDVETDLGVVDGRTAGVVDGEVGGAGAESGVDLGDGFGVGGRGGLGWSALRLQNRHTQHHQRKYIGPQNSTSPGILHVDKDTPKT